MPVATLTYVSDCYLPVNMDALLLVNGLKNLVAFGFFYGVPEWVGAMGYINAFGMQAGIFVGFMALGMPLMLYGETLRHRSAGWRIIM